MLPLLLGELVPVKPNIAITGKGSRRYNCTLVYSTPRLLHSACLFMIMVFFPICILRSWQCLVEDCF